jgi:hypothetical protein
VVGLVSKQELVVGAVAAAAATVAARWAARASGVRVARPDWLWRTLGVLPKHVVTDVGLLFRALLDTCRGEPPRSDVVVVQVGDAHPAERRPTVLAFAVAVLTTPPNTIVVDEAGPAELVVHRLVPTGQPARLVQRR